MAFLFGLAFGIALAGWHRQAQENDPEPPPDRPRRRIDWAHVLVILMIALFFYCVRTMG